MLINFTFENYSSFKNENTLSMEPGERLRKYPGNKIKIPLNSKEVSLLKNAVIFGSNGSGKSNILKSLYRMRQIVLAIPTKITTKLPHNPFLLTDTSSLEDTKFEVEFIIDKFQYKYSFSYNIDRINEEKLSILNKFGDYETYYHRYKDKLDTSINDISYEYFSETRKNVLFLQKLQDKNDAHAINVFNWFAQHLVFFENKPYSDLYEILENTKIKDKFLSFLKLADMNIIDVEVKPINNESEVEDKSSIKFLIETALEKTLNEVLINEMGDKEGKFEIQTNTNKYQLFTVYKKYDDKGNVNGKRLIPFGKESKGTKKLISIILNILSCEDNDRIYIFDEFDDAFHEELSAALIKIFNSLDNKKQFLLTSHEITLMDSTLRKDQIYFTEKIFTGVSELYSVFDFKDDFGSSRNDITFSNRYLKGNFGAVPNIQVNEIINLFGIEEES